MNTQNQTARRYHWYSEDISDFVCEPHSGIASQVKLSKALNLTAKESTKTRDLSVDLVQGGIKSLLSDLVLLDKYSTNLSEMVCLKRKDEELTLLQLSDEDFSHHPVEAEDFSKSPYLKKILSRVCEQGTQSYESFLATEGVGPKTVRALALVSEVIYGAKPSYRDPARYSFAHGGKDSIPFPVDQTTYDETIQVMSRAVSKTRLNAFEKDKAILRLKRTS